jgi:hypothetical protein
MFGTGTVYYILLYLESEAVPCRVRAAAVDALFPCFFVLAKKMRLELGGSGVDYTTCSNGTLELEVLKG